MISWLHLFDILGVAVFAISGTLMAHKKHMDGFGIIVLASVTAIGGGTLRDVILGMPVFWVHDTIYLYAILIAAFCTIVGVKYNSKFPLQSLFIADAIGLAFFNIMGAQKALSIGVTPLIAIVMGTMTGVFGGLIRDVICREIPLVFRGELYATTCIIGSSLFCLAQYLDFSVTISMLVGMTTTLLLRLMAMHWHWSLPVFSKSS